MASFIDSIDFGPLEQPVSKGDVQALVRYDPEQKFGTSRSSVRFTFFLVSVISFLIFSLAWGWHWLWALAVSIVAGVCAAMLGYRGSLLYQEDLARFYKFATINNLKFMYDQQAPNYPGVVFNSGNAREIERSLVFNNGVEIGNYHYVTGSGRESTTHKWGYVRVKLSRKLPNMLLDSQKNNERGMVRSITNLPGGTKRDQSLILEGDFNKYFTLYAPAEYKRDALYVFTPDVMAALVDSGADFDIEVIDDYLILYTQKQFEMNSSSEYKRLFSITEKLSSELIDQTKRYTDERVGNLSVNTIAVDGQRLKSPLNLSWLRDILPYIVIVICGIAVAIIYEFLIAPTPK